MRYKATAQILALMHSGLANVPLSSKALSFRYLANAKAQESVMSDNNRSLDSPFSRNLWPVARGLVALVSCSI